MTHAPFPNAGSRKQIPFRRATETHQTFNGTSWTINSTYYFIWEGGRIIQRRDNSTSAYICTNYFPEGEIRCYAGSLTKYYHTHDHLGSVYELTTTAGAVQAAYSFTPYGERAKRWGAAATDIAYTGHWNLKPSSASHPAASELSLTWFRAYDPKRGVWLNRDPIEEKGGINLYNYAKASPCGHVDPDGLSTETVGRCEILLYVGHHSVFEDVNVIDTPFSPPRGDCWRFGFIGCNPNAINKKVGSCALPDLPNHNAGMRTESAGFGGWVSATYGMLNQITDAAYDRMWQQNQGIHAGLAELMSPPCCCPWVKITIKVTNNHALSGTGIPKHTHEMRVRRKLNRR